MMFYFLIFIASLTLSFILTRAIRKIALTFEIVDRPDKEQGGRKIHSSSTPLLGGVSIFITYFFFLFIFNQRFLAGDLNWHHLLAFFLGGLVIIIGGVLDDKYNLPARQQIIFPLIAIVIILLGGVSIERITNPFGGAVNLSSLSLVSSLLIFVWLLGMMYTTKLLDGVDGLVSGIGVIGSLVIFLFTQTTRYFQPDIAFAAILLAGSLSGFLILNWHPAKIFLGEGGSLLLGYILGVLAIISGGKIAIALLIMGIPILDVVWTILRRLGQGKNPFKFADKKHLHHRLLSLGLSQRQTVLIFYSFSLAFGLSGLFLQSQGKFLLLSILVVLMLVMIIFFHFFDKKLSKNKPKLLLHICCAPCSAFITLKRLISKYEVTWYFFNSNLNSLKEYEHRLATVQEVATKFNIPLIIEPYDHLSWREIVKGREMDEERGTRCHICYYDRLFKTAKLAKDRGFDFFSTSLLTSPYKDTKTIIEYSQRLADKFKISFLNENFQAKNGYRQSQEFAKELGLYRQKYCGCEFSLFSK